MIVTGAALKSDKLVERSSFLLCGGRDLFGIIFGVFRVCCFFGGNIVEVVD
jgi:hypothetical protein